VTITRFYFNPPKQTGELPYSQRNDLVYLLAGFTLVICQKPRKMLRYINALQKVHVKDSTEAVGYNFFLKILMADSYFSLGKVKEFKIIHDQVSELFKAKESLFTPFMKQAFYSLKIKKAVLNVEYNTIPGYFKYLNQATEKSGNKLSKIFTINLLINNPVIVSQDEVFYKQLAYNNSKALRECGLSPEIFSNHDFSN
jgi:hypothetical protein